MNEFIFAMMPGNTDGNANPISMFIPIIGMLLVFYFLLIRPQQKRQKEVKKMIEALKKGDRVVTGSGMFGTVTGVRDDIVVLKIADDVKVEMTKGSITGIVEKGAE